ncbi:MAG: type II secretion system F family protein [Methanoregula sp.]|nr:type II secretion system F family protein [Methanoregula sp.]
MNIRNYVRRWIQRNPLRYQSLHNDLVSARMGLTLDQYLWRAILVALLTGILFAILGFFIGTFVTLSIAVGTVGIYNVFNLQIPAYLFNISTLVYIKFVIIIIAFILGSYLGYIFILRFPGIEKKSRAIKINLTIHNAVAYMYAMRKGGAEMMVIFRSLSENANIYGEVLLEFRQVVRDADFFGYDLVSAMRHLMETTPSEKLKTFLEDLLSVIESGGQMAEFFATRVRQYQEEARFEQKQFLNVLSLVAETYVTLFVAGPLFIIIIMVVMGMMGGIAVFQLAMVTYAFLPIGSVLFILLIDLISIKTETTERYIKVKVLHEYSDVKIVRRCGEEVLVGQLKKYDQVRNLIHFLQNPFESFIANVNRTLYVTIPVAILYLVLILWNVPHYSDVEVFIDVVDDHLVIALLIVLIPYAIFYAIWVRKVLGIQALIPEFLARMAGINQVGLTIAQAIGIMVNTNLGLLSYEIKKIKCDRDWGANFTEALVRFEERISTPAIARVVTLITKASEMSGHIGEVLAIASSDANMSETLKRERLAEMFIYTVIVYLSFFVFVFVIGVLITQFLPILVNVNMQGVPSSGALSGLGSVPVKTIGRLMYHACIIEAIFSGLIAGQMGESSVAAGVKHSCILLVIALIAFNYVIGVPA